MTTETDTLIGTTAIREISANLLAECDVRGLAVRGVNVELWDDGTVRDVRVKLGSERDVRILAAVLGLPEGGYQEGNGWAAIRETDYASPDYPGGLNCRVYVTIGGLRVSYCSVQWDKPLSS